MKTQNRKNQIIVGSIALVLVIFGVVIYTSRFEDTDNAYTAAHVATLSAKVSGIVTEVPVEENNRVKKGQILVRIDQREYKNAVDALTADLGSVEASLALGEKDLKRSEMLLSEKAGTQQEKDNDFTKVKQLQRKRDAIKAQLAQAELNLSFTEIRAPADGTLGKKLVEPGMVVNPGQPLLSFVDARESWIIANFKETQLKKMHTGQVAEIKIDSIGGKTFEGEIESFSPGTGATFALIPPDNATGNFTKIVQRLPVRIHFLPESVKGFEDRIAPGLSAEVKVFLK